MGTRSFRPPIKVSRPTELWGRAMAFLTLVAIAIVAYFVGRVESVWGWSIAIALAFFVPVALGGLYLERKAAAIVGVLAGLSLLLPLWMGVRSQQPLASLVTLGGIALLLPAWAFLFAALRASLCRRGKELRERLADRVGSLTAMGNAFRVDSPLEDVLQLAARTISESLDFDRVLIGLGEGSPPVLRTVAAVGVEGADSLRGRQIPLLTQDVTRTGRAYCVPRAQWSGVLEAFASAGQDGDVPEQALVVPMHDPAHNVRGIVAVALRADEQEPDSITVETLQLFAQQVAIAAANYRLYKDLRRRVDSLMLINEVGQNISSGLESKKILEGIVAGGAQLTNGDYGVLLTIDIESGRLKPKMAYGFELREGELFDDEQIASLTQRVVREGRAIVVSGQCDDADLRELLPRQPPMRSLLVVPLVEGREVSGALMSGAEREGAFDETDRIILSTLADQASVAIQNARLYERVVMRANQLATLNELGHTITSSLDLDTTLSLIMKKVEEAFNVEAGSLLLLEGGRLVFRESFGPAGEQVKPFSLEVGQGIAGWVAMTGQSVLVSDAKQDQRHFAGIDQATSYATRSLVCVPLKGPEGIIGVFELMNPRDRAAFTNHDLALLESVATYAVVAIQNAKLHQQTVRHVNDLYALYRVGRAMMSTLDIDEMARTITRETLSLTAAARSQMVLLDIDGNRVTHVEAQGYEEPRPHEWTWDQITRGLYGWVLREKVYTISADVNDDERMRDADVELVAGKDAGSMIVAPLIIKGEPVGLLGAVRLAGDPPFGERELGLLNMLAGQASVAVQNARLFEERKRQIFELSILNQTGQALSSTLRIEDLVRLIHHQVARVMDADNFYIALYDAQKDLVWFPLVYENGMPVVTPQTEPSPLELTGRSGRHGLTEHIIRTREPLWFPNRVSERLEELGVERFGRMARSWLGVPILSGEQVLGVIAVQSYEHENVYDQEHLELLMTIASQAAVAIRNAQLFAKVRHMTENLERLVEERTEALAQANRELRIERDRLNSLYRITRELSQSLEVDRALNRTLLLINRALGAQLGYILLNGADENTLVYRAIIGHTPPAADGTPFPMPRPGEVVTYKEEQGLYGWLVAHRESLCVADLSGDDRWAVVEGEERWHRSLLAAPILSGDDPRGVIVLYHSEPSRFTDDHRRMLDAIASQISISVSNSDLFRLFREAADRLGRMLRKEQLEAAKNQAILEGVADGVVVTDAQGKITLFNAAAERILAIPRDEIIGRSGKEVAGLFNMSPASWSELTTRWSEGEFEQGTLYEERFEVEGRAISVHISPVIRHGVFEGTVSVFRDITRDVEVDRMKSEFISMVSHELRTPMTSIKGYIDLLHSGMVGPISDAQKNFLQIVKSNADRLTMLVNDLLDISRIETGRLKLSLRPTDLHVIIGNVITDLTPKAGGRGQTLESLVKEPLPAVYADPDRVTQILTNLVDNAIKYTPTGGRIAVDAEVVSQFVHVHVIDNGIGISEEDQEKLFTRFFRADNPLVQASSGTGLGLTIVKAIVELHGGEIWFKSALGEGSTFSFSLPLAEERDAAREEREFRTISYRARDRHILVVDSEVKDAELIAHQLRAKGGYRVHVVGCGRDAIEYLTNGQSHIDLVTLNLRLPDMDGLEVVQKIREQPALADLPIVLLSMVEQRGDGQHPGVQAYLSKPIESGQLLTTVERLLAGQRPVLIAEDDAALADSLKELLERKGMAAVVVGDGDSALRVARKEQPGLILLDIKLPGVDGYRVLSKLKEMPETRDIPVIVITGSVTDAEAKKERVLSMGAAQFLTKPVPVGELIAEIKRVLGNGNAAD